MKPLFSVLFVLLLHLAYAQDDATLQNRLRDNFFVKVEASSTDVFVGEPIVVTYKLYSALESESNIVSRPSFIGFDIKDLTTTNSTIAARENIDGVVFDVHTILKLQLTPYKAGRLSLGSLVMKNRVRLVNANGRKDPILDGIKDDYSLNNGFYTFQTASLPVTVLATALPQASRPSVYNGVIGLFTMNVTTSKSLYAPDEKGALTITILGVGNFSKIPQPEIKWPEGVKVFSTNVDEEESHKKDGDGYKSFTIPFSVSQPGKYVIPSIDFTFFDITINKYKTITNIPITFNVVAEGGAKVDAVVTPSEKETENWKYHNFNILLYGIGILLVLMLLLWIIFRKKQQKNNIPQQKGAVPSRQTDAPKRLQINIEVLLQPAADAIYSTGNTYSNCLKRAIISFFENKYALHSNSFNQESVKTVLANHQIDEGLQVELLLLLSTLDIDIYSGGSLNANKENLLNNAKSILHRLS